MIIEYKASVQKDLKGLDSKQVLRIVASIERALSTEGRGGEARSGQFAGLFKLRVGAYRVICARTESGSLVLRIAHRREAYRKK